VPFRTVFLHAMVRDETGEKMSKTRGNVIDPLEVTEEYGADALRFTLAAMAGQGRTINLSLGRVAGYQAFTNKIWNIARFALPHLEDRLRQDPGDLQPELELADRWILSRLNRTVDGVTDALDRFRFQDAAELVYGFIWGELADWYVELVKPRLYGDAGETSQAAARATLAHVIDASMRLLHPIMPFVTEAVWQRLPRRDDDPASLMVAAWPVPRAEWDDVVAEERIIELQEIIGAVRNLRAEYGVQPGARIPLWVAGASEGLHQLLSRSPRALLDLARVDTLEFRSGAGAVGATAVLRSGAEAVIPLEGVIDLARERQRLREELERVRGQLRSTGAKLANEGFVSRAPAEVVQRERDKLQGFEEQSSALEAKLRILEGGT
jgi:valyl-tRNA synthetase